MMTPEEIAAAFARPDGSYAFARWGRPIVPVVFGVEDETLAIVKGAIEAVVSLAGHRMGQMDGELGANLMIFFLREWEELLELANLGRMIPDLEELVARLREAGAHQYRLFRYDEAGAVRACFAFLRMDEAALSRPAEEIALALALRVILPWGEGAFAGRAPLVAGGEGGGVLRPEFAAIVRAAYDPVLPDVADDPSHALRLFARMEA